MQPEDIASIGYKSLMKGKRTTTAGLYNKLLVFSSKLLPISVINSIVQCKFCQSIFYFWWVFWVDCSLNDFLNFQFTKLLRQGLGGDFAIRFPP